MTNYLENREISGNFAAVRELSGMMDGCLWVYCLGILIKLAKPTQPDHLSMGRQNEYF